MMNHTFSVAGLHNATTGVIWGDEVVEVILEIETRKKQGWKLVGQLQPYVSGTRVMATMEREPQERLSDS